MRRERATRATPVAVAPRDLDSDPDELGEGESADPRTVALVAAVRAHAGQPCRACARPLCGHEVVLSVLLGYRSAPRCARCLAGETGEEPAALCERVLGWLRARDCYRAAWESAGRLEGSHQLLRPACLFGGAERRAPSAALGATPSALLPFDEDFDAGDMACGELVLELRLRLSSVPERGVLRVSARDPAAPVDLPAWCGLTGHGLLSARHPLYWIERKPSPPT